MRSTCGSSLGHGRQGGAVLAYSPNAVWWGGALVAGAIGAGALLAGDRIPDKPLAATESKAPAPRRYA